MIINTGCRTDIPAFYSEWFYKRIQEGYVLSRNPYYPELVTKYRLSPDVVDILCFCTKNPSPMLKRLDEIRMFSQFWFVTITPYGRDIEPNVPPKEKVMESFQQLSRRVGTKAIGWRYDPIFLNEKYTFEFHCKVFEEMARELCGSTDHCVVSFIDLYEKTKRNFPGIKDVSLHEQEELIKTLVGIGRKYGITIRTCCEQEYLKEFGADTSGCLTQDVLERAIGCSLTIPKKKPAREACNCLLGNDIGMYNTCDHACLYCYANYDRKTVVENKKLHDTNSPFLIGSNRDGDVIREAKQERYQNGQLNLSDFLSL